MAFEHGRRVLLHPEARRPRDVPHASETHLHRCLKEFDFRYNTRAALGVDDTTRTNETLKGSSGKRLSYRRAGEGAHA